jgi:hypothetical protein
VFKEDDKLSLKLSRAVEYLRNGTTILEHGYEEGTTGNVNYPDFWSLSEWNWVQYTISVLVITTFGTVIGLIVVCCQLQGLAHAEELQMLTMPPMPKIRHFGETEPPPDKSMMEQLAEKYEEALGVVNIHQFEMFLGLIALMLLVMFVVSRIRKCCKRIRGMRVKTYLAFRFNNAASEIVIKGQVFRAVSDDLWLDTDTTPSEFEIIGLWFPKLSFLWEAVVIDHYENKVYRVESTVSVSWLEAAMLRRVFENKFYVTPMIRSHGKTGVLRKEKDYQAALKAGKSPESIMEEGIPEQTRRLHQEIRLWEIRL